MRKEKQELINSQLDRLITNHPKRRSNKSYNNERNGYLQRPRANPNGNKSRSLTTTDHEYYSKTLIQIE